MLPLHEIDWIEAADNYARLWIGRRSHLIRESLRDLESRARAHGFVRAHRKAIVRLDGVRELRSSGGTFVAVLACGTTVPVSRRQRARFVAAVRSLGT